jgi:hypothetical protein
MKRKRISKTHTGEASNVAERDIDIYLSPRELAARWKCARSTADRIVTQAGLTKVLLGEGKNGMVRYLRAEVAAYETSRRT